MADVDKLIQAVHAGGEALKKYFGKALNPVEKSTLWDFQTEADLESEKSILAVLKSAFPDYNIFSEEEGQINNNSEYTLIIDPLDGTNNFVLGMPTFTVSIGLMHKDTAIAGVVYQPILDQTFHAFAGKGAFLNNEAIRVSKITEHNKLTIAYNCNYKTDRLLVANLLKEFISSVHKRLLINWSPAFDFCLLASGRIESVITDNIELHDFAAAKLIAKEAGAKVVDFSGKEEVDFKNSRFVISNTDEVNSYVVGIAQKVQDAK